jgi:hypothetical protein
VKVPGRKVMPANVSVSPKGMSTAPSKSVPTKATHTMQASKASMVPRTSAPSRAVTPSRVVMSKIAVTVAVMVTASRVAVLKISIIAKRLVAALSLMAKGKQAKVDAMPPPSSVTPHVISMW